MSYKLLLGLSALAQLLVPTLLPASSNATLLSNSKITAGKSIVSGFPSLASSKKYLRKAKVERNKKIIEVDFEDAFYDFDNMPATYASSASQLLLFHAGVSVNMDYDCEGSGAQVPGGYPSALYALENNFLYKDNI